jgi:hypothetical protein
MRTNSIYIAISLSFFSINESQAMNNDVTVKDCEMAFHDMINNKGQNLWETNLVDHVESTTPKKVGDTYFYTEDATRSDVSAFLSKNSCLSGTYDFLGPDNTPKQWKCTNMCKKNNIGYKYNGDQKESKTKKVFFTIRKTENQTRAKSKWMIFNIYPTLN